MYRNVVLFGSLALTSCLKYHVTMCNGVRYAGTDTEAELPDHGLMSLRPATQQQNDTAGVFEEHAYGFKSLVNRETVFVDSHQLEKRICYCTDSLDCSPQRLFEIGRLILKGKKFFELPLYVFCNGGLGGSQKSVRAQNSS